MKKIIKRSTLIMLLIAVLASGLMAQPQRKGNMNGAGPAWSRDGDPQSRMEMAIPDLTEDQKTQLKALHMEHMKSTEKHRNLMGEINAKQKTLMSESTIDQKALGKLIDERTALMNKQMKESIAHKAAVKELLTEEQQLHMKQHMKMKQMKMKKMDMPRGQCVGNCPGCGMHRQQARRGVKF